MQVNVLTFSLALSLIAVYSGHAFTSQVKLTNTRTTSSAIFGKRERALKKVKKIFGSEDAPAEVKQVQSNFPTDGQKVKLSDGKARDLAKKYNNIEDLGEKAFQVLTDLKMVERS